MEVLGPVVGTWVSLNPGKIAMTIIKMSLNRVDVVFELTHHLPDW